MKNSLVFVWIVLASAWACTPMDPEQRVYEVRDNAPASNSGRDFSIRKAGGYPFDKDWEAESYPIGNGYMGANVFGRTDTERIQITEKTLYNSGRYGLGGLTSFADLYLDFNHQDPENYRRTLNLNEAILYVEYENEGVKYSREYFMNYPDNVLVVKLDADRKKKLSFTIRPEIPYLESVEEKNKKTGRVTARDDLLTLSGNIRHFNINYEGQLKVITKGGEISSHNAENHAEIRVTNANSVVLIFAAGTNYQLSSQLFLEQEPGRKLDPSVFPRKAVSERVERAAEKGYEKLRNTHLGDYQPLFSRVEMKLADEVPGTTTRELLEDYRAGGSNVYLEELMYHFGRYLLIASSRKGTLPCGLQGIWSQYEVTPWTGGYWHNINVQMNYWGAFSSNLPETFLPYMEYFEAYLPQARNLAKRYIETHRPEVWSGNTDDCGWIIGTGATAYVIGGPGGHSGPGTGGFTSQLFWDYYEFTRDTAFLGELAYPCLYEMSRFFAKSLKPDENGILLVEPSASPEQRHNGEYYVTSGTAFDQSFVWENHTNLIKAAGILGRKDDFLNTVKDQVAKLDPILVGKSGQIKEYREEEYYSDIGDEHHRHVSHLCALYPGTLINSNTPDWMEAAKITLDRRGNNTTGWAMAHRMNLRARTGEAGKAHEVYSKFIRERTLPNLWTVHPPFQIDGNLGCMAGVAEMLLQSHEGFTEILPALPQAWADGEFKGLMARGNFEISAVWADGKASSIEIYSGSGGRCAIRYPGIDHAILTDAAGESVPFKKEGSDLIGFETDAEERYIVTLQ